MRLAQVSSFVAGCLLLLASAAGAPEQPRDRSGVTEIAHAGGAVQGLAYTNSLNALNENYARGYRYFEVDLHRTADGQVVLLHDWNNSMENLFGVAPGRRTLAEFRQLRMTGGMQQLDLWGLVRWMAAHPDAYVILDTKEQTVATLAEAAFRYPRFRQQAIAYVHTAAQYQMVRRTGYQHVMLILAASSPSDAEVVALARQASLVGVALPRKRAASDLPRALRELGVRSYVWTINDPRARAQFQKNHLSGVITDALLTPDPARQALAAVNASVD